MAKKTIVKLVTKIPEPAFVPRKLVRYGLSPQGTAVVLMPRSRKELLASMRAECDYAYRDGKTIGAAEAREKAATAGGNNARQESIVAISRSAADLALANSKLTYAMAQILARANGEQGGWK